MKEMSIQDFARDVNTAPKRDVIVSASSLTVDAPLGERGNPFVVSQENELVWDSPVTPHAADQLYGYVGKGFISYGRQLASEGNYELLDRNVRERFEQLGDKKFLLRGHGVGSDAVTRALLSDKYKIIDTDQVLDAALPVISDKERFKALGGGRSQTKDFMKFIERSPSFSVRDQQGRNREFSVGFVFSNSEVGAGYTNFELFISDHFCMNGCIFAKTLLAQAKLMHRGSTLVSGLDGFIDRDVHGVAEAKILQGIQNATRKACSWEGTQKIKELVEASFRPIEAAPDKVIREVGKRLALPEKTVDAVMADYVAGGNQNVFGVQAAITSVAQKQNTYQDRIDLEKAGGSVMEYSASAWKSIEALAAA